MSPQKHYLPSLIPYLDQIGTRLGMRISQSSEDPAVLEKGSDPFPTLTESGPFTRLHEARFVINSGSEIRRVFLLVQRDVPLHAKDELRPVCNKDIDRFWHETFLFYSGKLKDGSLIVLPDQVREDGGISPFQSLFFCKMRQRFFCPPCPKCGSPLQQCYNDDLLTRLGLEPYSTSLRRYLFCPSCLDSVGNSDFYVVSLNRSDPSDLKDQKDLVRGFGRIMSDGNLSTQFPCAECPDRQRCYGADDLGVSRITPFSFYPFFILIFESMSLNAVDFLALISGASFQELETHLAGKQELGRIKCLKDLTRKSAHRTKFFFDSNEKYFLEVLYLKLSFLGELVQIITSGSDSSETPDFSPALDRVWVTLPDQGELLPYYWNFKVDIIDLGEKDAEVPFSPESHPNYGLHYLGLVWFFTFLVNKKQEVSDLYAGIRQAAKEIESNSDSVLAGFMGIRDNPVFYPDNIFWNPEDRNNKSLNPDLKLLWEESLGLGWSLLKAGRGVDFQWSRDEFLQKLNSIVGKIKDYLFQKGHIVNPIESAQENSEIHEILFRIAEKWNSDLNIKQNESEGAITSEQKVSDVPACGDDAKQDEGDVCKTVILSSEFLKKEGLSSGHSEDELEGTVILSPKHGVIPGLGDAGTQDDAQGSQTVEESGSDMSLPGTADGSEIPGTVIISSRNALMKDMGLKETDSLLPQDEGMDLEATMIIKKVQEKSDGNDSLPETRVLRPEERKIRK